METVRCTPNLKSVNSPYKHYHCMMKVMKALTLQCFKLFKKKERLNDT